LILSLKDVQTNITVNVVAITSIIANMIIPLRIL
jgi:hypothetical protein